MGKRKEKIYVIGHKNPDTDSICSAIAYADLRQKVTGQVHEAKRAGHVNDETAYVLDRFGVEAPKLLTDVRLQVRDLDIHEMPGLKPNASIRSPAGRLYGFIQTGAFYNLEALHHYYTIGRNARRRGRNQQEGNEEKKFFPSFS